MVIVGINAYHGDSSACLVRDGKLIAAAEEERFRRIKHWAGFPSEAIHYCLEAANVNINEVDYIAINRNPKANLWKKFRYLAEKRPELSLIKDRIKNVKEWGNVTEKLKEMFGIEKLSAKISYVEHHLAHIISTYNVSPFDESIVLSIDGFGDFASAAWGVGQGNEVRIDDRVYFPHSLGIFYQTITQFLGFPKYGDEYKVMGLASYGKPTFINEMREIVKLDEDGKYRLNLDYFRHDKEDVSYTWNNCAPSVGILYSDKLKELLGNPRDKDQKVENKHMNLAHSAQLMYEEAFFHLLNKLYNKYDMKKLCLSGGCAMNSVANGKIYENTSFEKVYVPPAAGDAGGSIGAAYNVWYNAKLKSKSKTKQTMDHAFWGPGFDKQDISKLLNKYDQRLQQEDCAITEVNDDLALCKKTAEYIEEGRVVGWFEGRMELGPRALGNRSIVSDPRRSNMKDILNLKIKRREPFRPFAPSILREHVKDWFETDDNVPFMNKVFQIKEDKRKQIPAVTHIDGSGRLQTVSKESNTLYYNLINEFRSLTGIPIVLNTSFNENEPIVCTPEEALECFLRTKMDVVVLNSFIIIRN